MGSFTSLKCRRGKQALQVVSRCVRDVAPLLLAASSGRSLTPSCSPARPPSGPRARGSWPGATLWPRSPGQGSALARGSGGCPGWSVWTGMVRPHLCQKNMFVLFFSNSLPAVCLLKWRDIPAICFGGTGCQPQNLLLSVWMCLLSLHWLSL